MAKGKRRAVMSERKRRRQTAAYREGDKTGKSPYARKKRWLAKHGLWGFQVPEPKPWKQMAG